MKSTTQQLESGLGLRFGYTVAILLATRATQLDTNAPLMECPIFLHLAKLSSMLLAIDLERLVLTYQLFISRAREMKSKIGFNSVVHNNTQCYPYFEDRNRASLPYIFCSTVLEELSLTRQLLINGKCGQTAHLSLCRFSLPLQRWGKGVVLDTEKT